MLLRRAPWLLLQLDQAWVTCGDSHPGGDAKGPSKAPTFLIDLGKGKGELLDKERGHLFDVGDWALDNDCERRLLGLAGLGRVNGLRCSLSPEWTPMFPPGPALKVLGLVGRGPSQATPISFPTSLGKSGESVVAMNSP